MQRGGRSIVLGSAVLLELVEGLSGEGVEVALLHPFFVELNLLGHGVFGGLAGSGGVQKTDRNHTDFAVFIGDRRAELDAALRPDQVDIEVRTERILAVSGTGDGFTGLAQNGVVQRDTQRTRRRRE